MFQLNRIRRFFKKKLKYRGCLIHTSIKGEGFQWYNPLVEDLSMKGRWKGKGKALTIEECKAEIDEYLFGVQ